MSKETKKGLIVVAYQGMGKTTLTEKNKNYFDLESSNYDKSDELWYKKYVQDAIKKVTEDGYDICFTSSHAVVREELIKQNAQFVIFYPSVPKEQYVEKLAVRYFKEKTIKNGSALANAVLDYEKNIKELRLYSNSISSDTGFMKQDVLDLFTGMDHVKREKVIANIGYAKTGFNKKFPDKPVPNDKESSDA